MSRKKFYAAFWLWLKITLTAYFLLSAVILLLLVLLTIIGVPSFAIGNEAIWLLRWQYEPGVRFGITFNPASLFFIAGLIGIVGLWLKQKRNRSQSQQLRRHRR